MRDHPIRVLIVDDHQLFADALKLMLDREDSVEVIGIAPDGPEAVDLALSGDAEVVLMDIGLPTFDGFEAACKLRSIKKAAKVIAVTGRAPDEISDQLSAAGMVGYLSKDKIHETVVAAIHAAIAKPS
jgi:DNA-binding NarL/FixJ family response regulator